MPLNQAGGIVDVCHGAEGWLAACSSSARYKMGITSSALGLDLVERLRPVEFQWTATGADDLGLIAEEVAAVEPLLVTANSAGEVEGVKVKQLTAVLVNAIKEQQVQISKQSAEIAALATRLEALD